MDEEILKRVPSRYRKKSHLRVSISQLLSPICTFDAEVCVFKVSESKVAVFVHDYSDLHEFIGVPQTVFCGEVSRQSLVLYIGKLLTEKFHHEKIAVPSYPSLDELANNCECCTELGSLNAEGLSPFEQESVALMWGTYGEENHTLLDLLPELNEKFLARLWQEQGTLLVQKVFNELNEKYKEKSCKELRHKLLEYCRSSPEKRPYEGYQMATNCPQWEVGPELVSLLEY